VSFFLTSNTIHRTPLVRAYDLEEALGTPAHIYFKNESVSPAGSHKLNSALAQAYYAKKQGIKNITTETGAGQWGGALSYAAKKFGLECAVYMVKVSYDQKPYRKSIMQTFGAAVTPSPSMSTRAGKDILTANPMDQGSLGCAISEAIELALTTPDCRYTLGSVLNHVCLHQTVIGLEAVDIDQTESFRAGVLFAQTEGIIPAPESCHAIAATVAEALKCKETGEQKTILFNLSGHAFVDMAAYDQYLSGQMQDFHISDQELAGYISQADALNK